ncbi:MAG: alpha/beta fold hydrolase [Phycisphaeraceae bacterium]
MTETPPTSRRRLPHWSIRMLVYLLIALLVWAAAVWLLQRQVLFPRHLANEPPAVAPPDDAEVWWLETGGGRVEAWLLPGHGVSADRPGPAVIVAHGNGERIDFWVHALEPYRELGVTVLMPEYRGYGRSDGTPSADAILDDFARFHDRLASRDDVDADRIFFHGRSLGGATLGTLTADRTPAALILESTFTSTADMARGYLVPGFMVRDRFDARAGLRAYAGPVLLMHGERDSVIPPDHARQLHAAAANSELVWFDTDHNDILPGGAYWQAITTFLRDHGLTAHEAPAP